MDPEIEYVNPIRCRGAGNRRGLAAFSRAVAKVFEGGRPAHGAGTAQGGGDQVAVVVPDAGAGAGRSRGSGVGLWTLRDGKVVRYAWFHEPADALEAAGLSE